ncbi:MAG: hypothetical protein SFU85_11270 [Candidatus Methylacidiphilales bacterium]|nr:hypothetical protein [Candidatus Methylacidiphilales bacterium]
MARNKYQRVTARVEVPPSNLYYIWRDHTEHGPFMTEDVLEFWHKGELLAEDYIRESHSTDWVDTQTFLMPIMASEATHPEQISLLAPPDTAPPPSEDPPSGRMANLSRWIRFA